MNKVAHWEEINLTPPADVPAGVAYTDLSRMCRVEHRLEGVALPPHPGILYKKVGILPFYRDEAGLHFLLASPDSKKAEDKGKIQPFQLARGTPRATWPDGSLLDLREDAYWKEAGESGYPVETSYQTALNEGKEELGLKPENIASWIYCGTVPYRSKDNGGYGIDLHLVEIKNRNEFPLSTEDSQAIGWHFMKRVEGKRVLICENDTENRGVKEAYLPIFALAEQSVHNAQEMRQTCMTRSR